MNDIEGKDTEANTKNRQIRDRTIDSEVESKKVLTDIVRIKEMTVRENQHNKERLEELDIELKQISISRDHFRSEMDQIEAELRYKLELVDNQSRELEA